MAMLNNMFEFKTKSSLCVVAFSMGCYVAGSYTHASLQAMQDKGYPMSVITPGINAADTFKMIRTLFFI